MTDAELPRVSAKTFPRARIAHKCVECGGEIAAGERYESFRGLWDGRWKTIRTCPDCVQIRDLIYGADAYEIGTLRDAVQYETSPHCLWLIIGVMEKRRAPHIEYLRELFTKWKT